jgi:hypothetical protein
VVLGLLGIVQDIFKCYQGQNHFQNNTKIPFAVHRSHSLTNIEAGIVERLGRIPSFEPGGEGKIICLVTENKNTSKTNKSRQPKFYNCTCKKKKKKSQKSEVSPLQTRTHWISYCVPGWNMQPLVKNLSALR